MSVFCVYLFVRLQIAVHFMRGLAVTTAREQRLRNDVSTLSKTACTAVEPLPEAVLEELQAAAVVNKWRTDVNVAIAKGTPLRTSCAFAVYCDTCSERLHVFVPLKFGWYYKAHSAQCLCRLCCALCPCPLLA